MVSTLPGKQAVRDSIPGRGTTDFVRQFLLVYLLSFIALL